MSEEVKCVDEKRLKIARHEAGHAVMALICGQKVQTVGGAGFKRDMFPRFTGTRWSASSDIKMDKFF